MPLRLPIGYENFQDIRTRNFDLVDKSLLIKELFDDEISQIVLLTRPRRFGKTLNLSMLECFLAPETVHGPTKGLFDDLNIARVDGDYMKHQGKYPVIFVTLKNVSDGNFEHALQQLAGLISNLYSKHDYLLSSAQLSDRDKKKFQEILEEKANQATLESSLQYLTELLHKHHGVRPWILIDEYDSPIQAAYLHGYYQEMITFMRNMFGMAFKTNPHLNRAVITGILRVSKESLFSGLNNIRVYSLLKTRYSEYFGFTEKEVDDLLTRAELNDKKTEIQNWYNGYQFGETLIYNPWSIINCIEDKGACVPYWVNTSGNNLIEHLVMHSDESVKKQFESILQGGEIEATIDENMVFGDLTKNPSAIWSLLLFSGYLKATHTQNTEHNLEASLSSPNLEVTRLYRSIVYRWFTESMGEDNYKAFLVNLTEGRIEQFTERLQYYLLEAMSFFDASGKHPEKFYHGLVLGLISVLSGRYEINSNKESGLGRYDVMLVPKDPSKLGIIMEFKVAQENEELTESAQKALQQIIDRAYATDLKKRGITHIMHLGLAFRGKHVEVVQQAS